MYQRSWPSKSRWTSDWPGAADGDTLQPADRTGPGTVVVVVSPDVVEVIEVVVEAESDDEHDATNVLSEATATSATTVIRRSDAPPSASRLLFELVVSEPDRPIIRHPLAVWSVPPDLGPF